MMLNRRLFDELTPEADLNERGAGVDQKVILISFKKSFFFNFLKKQIFIQNAMNISLVPTIYLCATMWHETTNKMAQLLNSIGSVYDVEQASF